MLQVCISRFPCSCHVAFWEKIVIVTQHSSLGVLRDRSKEGFTEKAIVTLYGLFSPSIAREVLIFAFNSINLLPAVLGLLV